MSVVLEKELPKGWVELEFEKTIKNIPLNGKKLKQKEYLKTGKFPVIDQGQDFIGGFTDKENFLVECNLPIIIFGDHTKNIKFVNQDFVAGADGIKVLQPNSFFVPKLLYYFIQAMPLPSKGYSRHYQYLQKSNTRLPPLNEQKRIVAKIEELFSLIETNLAVLEKIIKNTSVLENSVLHYAFSGKLTEKWRIKNKDLIGVSAKITEIENELFKQRKFVPIKSEDLSNIPKEWIWTRMNVVCSKVTDGTHFSPPNTPQGDFPYVTAKNIRSWGIDLSKITYVTKEVHSEIYSRCNPEKGDVLYIKDGVTTGLAAVNEFEYEFSMLSSLALLKPNKAILDSYFLKNFLNNPITFKRLTGRMTGTAIRRIILQKIREAEIPIPPIEEQREIVKEINLYSSLTKNLKEIIEQEINRLNILKNQILKQAFEGKLVPQDPNDEPAEILLQKIKQEKQKIIKETVKPRKKKNDK